MNISTVNIIVSSPDINNTIAQSNASWVMLCDSMSTLVAGAAEKLLKIALSDEETEVVIGGIDEPDESIFTLQGKLFRTEILRQYDINETDVKGECFALLQAILGQCGRRVKAAPFKVLEYYDKSLLEDQMTPAHRELLKRMNYLYAEIQLCDRCNLNCAYCSHFAPVAKPYIISMETLTAECQRLKHLNLHEINLLGGEPLLHPRLAEAIRLVRSILPDTKITIATNGQLLCRMKSQFWRACRECDVTILITPYPNMSAWKYYLTFLLVRMNRVHLKRFEFRREFRHQLLSQQPRTTDIRQIASSYLSCMIHCTQVRDATLWPCAYAAYAFSLNEHFGTSFKTAPADGLPLNDDLTATDVRLWLFRAKPFCSHCGFLSAKKEKWHRSNCERGEWVED
jgi:organic radical activating enzyme